MAKLENVYLFFNEENKFRPVVCRSINAARKQAEKQLNIIKVEDINGKIVWLKVITK